jgi:hypothetical protein
MSLEECMSSPTNQPLLALPAPTQQSLFRTESQPSSPFFLPRFARGISTVLLVAGLFPLGKSPFNSAHLLKPFFAVCLWRRFAGASVRLTGSGTFSLGKSPFKRERQFLSLFLPGRLRCFLLSSRCLARPRAD